MTVMKELGLLPVWQRRVRDEVRDDADEAAPPPDWHELLREVADCPHCVGPSRPLGVGDRQAPIWIVLSQAANAGRAPSSPWQGMAGRLLRNMLRSIGLQPEQVFLTVLARQAPAAETRSSGLCMPHLMALQALLKPRVVLNLTGHATPPVELNTGICPVFAGPAPEEMLAEPVLKAHAWALLKQIPPIVSPA